MLSRNVNIIRDFITLIKKKIKIILMPLITSHIKILLKEFSFLGKWQLKT